MLSRILGILGLVILVGDVKIKCIKYGEYNRITKLYVFN